MTPHTPVDTLESIVAEMRASATELRVKAGEGTHVLHATARKNAETVNAWADRLASLNFAALDALRQARTFVAYAFDQRILGAEEAGLEIDRVLAGNALASLPVEGWRVHLLDDAPFPNPLAVLTAPNGARHVVVKGDNELLCTFLAHIAQRQGNEQGGTHE